MRITLYKESLRTLYTNLDITFCFKKIPIGIISYSITYVMSIPYITTFVAFLKKVQVMITHLM